jgi:hypothetical protein
MLTVFWSEGETCRREVNPQGPSLPVDVAWFDLLNPDPAIQRAVEEATGLALPSSHATSQTSRVRAGFMPRATPST